jgi:hypothetical protein
VDGITYKLDLIAEIEDKGEEIEHWNSNKNKNRQPYHNFQELCDMIKRINQEPMG